MWPNSLDVHVCYTHDNNYSSRHGTSIFINVFYDKAFQLCTITAVVYYYSSCDYKKKLIWGVARFAQVDMGVVIQHAEVFLYARLFTLLLKVSTFYGCVHEMPSFSEH